MSRRRWTLRKLVCRTCGILTTALVEDGETRTCHQPIAQADGHGICAGALERPDPVAPQSPTVLDDGLWGGARFIENLAPQPIWCETKSQYRALLAAHGMEQKVRHVPVPGTDKSPITTRWALPLPPGVDGRPFAMLSPTEQIVRRQEAAVRFGMTVATLEAIGLNLETTLVRVPATPSPACEFIPDR